MRVGFLTEGGVGVAELFERVGFPVGVAEFAAEVQGLGVVVNGLAVVAGLLVSAEPYDAVRWSGHSVGTRRREMELMQ